METRTLFGLQLQQKRNNGTINKSLFDNVTSQRKDVSNTLLYYLFVNFLKPVHLVGDKTLNTLIVSPA